MPLRVGRRARILIAVASSLLVMSAGATATTASGASTAAPPLVASPADTDLPYTLTIAARQCPSYDAIMANRARNNIQESLRDLGKDTVYTGGEPVSPGIEDPNDPLCRPLDGWRFQLGGGGGGGRVDNLSTVSDPGRVTDSTTTVPLLDDQGQDTGTTIRGATTLTLTSDEVARAQSGQNLWLQGGTTSDPLLYASPVNSRRTFGFGALRCAVDNLNGDNIEWVGYTGSARHTFCYYYTVGRAPDPGTIVVRKQITAGTDTHSFRFNGDVSYVPGGDFSLDVNQGRPAQTSFVRAAGDTWSFTELDDAQFEATGPPQCTSASGNSTFTITGAQVQVVLGEDDVATCTYTNQRRPTGPLRLDKVSLGGIGTFPFTIVRPDTSVRQETVTTTRAGQSVLVADAPSGPNGTWRVSETLPADRGGAWKLNRVTCNGVDVPFDAATASASFDVAVGQQLGCTAENLFTPAGRIILSKTTVGGTGTFSYVVRDVTPPQGSDGSVGTQQATTTHPGAPATPATGDALTGLQVYTPIPAGGQREGHLYEVTELTPPITSAGTWRATATCRGGRSTPLGGGYIQNVVLTPDQPVADCDFVNTFVPSATLSVTKVVTGDPSGRSGPVQVDLGCAREPTRTLLGPLGQPGPFTLAGQPLVYQFPRDDTVACSLTEVATGVADGAEVATHTDVTVNGTTVSYPGANLTVTLKPADVVSVTVTDDYTVTPTTPPTTAPTTTPTTPPTTVPTTPPPATTAPTAPPTLPDTGILGLDRLLFGAFGLLVTGTALLALSGRRRRPSA